MVLKWPAVSYRNACCLVLDLQISVYGMNERIGLVSFPPRQEAFDKPYSQETAHMIDQEVCAAVLAGLVCDLCSRLFLPESNNRQTAAAAYSGRAAQPTGCCAELCALYVCCSVHHKSIDSHQHHMHTSQALL